MRTKIAVLIGSLIIKITKLLKLGAGATWPGEIALWIQPKLIGELIPSDVKVVVVAGTNGKTTTSKMISSILGKSVIHNETGANLLNGIASILIKNQRKADFYVFEVDEGALPLLLKQITPTVLVLMNLFRDQLDRYGEVDSIAKKWLKVLKNISKTEVILNGDDPHLAWIGKNLTVPVHVFGIDDKTLYLEKMPHATDSTFCPNCGNRLTYTGVYFSHLGDFKCLRCRFSHPKNEVSAYDWESPLPGVYNIYNTIAAGLTGQVLGISQTQISKGLKSFTPAFGRSEEILVDGKKVKLLLSKNPTGFNESLRAFLTAKGDQLLLVLNDKIPDGRDISWIWDVDFEVLNKFNGSIVISGDRVWDLGLRLKYALESKTYYPFEDLDEAIKTAISKLDKGQTLWILPTYSAMLEVRKILLGRKIL